jgi:hypothetical protein
MATLHIEFDNQDCIAGGTVTGRVSLFVQTNIKNTDGVFLTFSAIVCKWWHETKHISVQSSKNKTQSEERLGGMGGTAHCELIDL